MNTLTYYNTHAQQFIDSTINADLSTIRNNFFMLPESASVLDFGCGSGRDTKYFLEKGYQVTAIDGSEELCRLASEYTGIKVKHMLFQELDEADEYDGIWVCSSILHIPKEELLIVLQKMAKALKAHAVIYNLSNMKPLKVKETDDILLI